MSKQHEFKVKIEMDWNATKREAYTKLKNWLEHNAHTSSSFGFELKEISNLGDDE